MRGGRCTILVVDDDDGVRELATDVLVDAGYEVLPAADGEEALRVLEEHPEIDLLFTDVVMPRVNGFTLARKAKARFPGLKIVYASGYVSMVASSDLRDYHGPLLNKPYRPSQLLAEIRRALGE